MNLPPLPPAPASVEQWIDLFLSRLDGGRMPYPEASNLLIAYSAWPNDRKARDQFMAANVGLSVAHLERRLALPGIASGVLAGVKPVKLSGRSALELFGGWETVAEAALSSVLDQLEKIQAKWPRVADIFHAIVDIAHEERVEVRGGPSISKAVELVEDARGLPGRSQLTAAWSEFHDVAHVLTAGAYLAHCAIERGDRRATSILSAILLVPDIVIALASGFQQFGLTTMPHGRKAPILDPETLWQVLESTLPKKLFLPVRLLTPRQIDLLQERRASKKNKPSPFKS